MNALKTITMMSLAAFSLAFPAPGRAATRELGFEDRVAAQRAIEQVYWSHRIWPENNLGPKPPFGEIVPEEALRAQVEDSLRQSALLASFWLAPLRGEELQAEIDRLSRESRSPEVLREIYAALGDDPVLIAECLARPLLAERRLAALFEKDERIPGAQRAAISTRLARATGPDAFARLEGIHHVITMVLDEGGGGEPAAIASPEPGAGALSLSREEWRGEIRTIAAAYFPEQASDPRMPGDLSPHPRTPSDPPASSLPLGRASRLLDQGDRFVSLMVLERSESRLTLETVSWAKRSNEDWSREAAASSTLDAKSVAPPEQGYSVPAPLLTACTYDTWTPTSTVNAPVARKDHTAVWTGTEMIVWGGHDGVGFINTGGRYNPATDTWIATSTSGAVPEARTSHAAVWTGTEMIVWGGQPVGGGSTNTGGRYNPGTNAWTATSTGASVPQARLGFAAVWTGTQMVVWGGFDATPLTYLNSGGRYTPGTNSWTPTSIGANVPAPRYLHSVVWTGSEMIVWGGRDVSLFFNTGGRYNPSSDSWLSTSTGANVPTARILHSAVWTGSEMIIFGGQPGGGSRYNPASDVWSANAAGPASRQVQTAIWTGNDMIAWGGQAGSTKFNDGGRFVPSTNTWAASSLTTGSGANVPSARTEHTAVFTGSTDHRMIVWGGLVGPASANVTQTGGLYCAGVCPDGSSCDDNSLCTTSDTCASGACAGTPVTCAPIDACHNAGSCIVATGQCSAGTVKPDGAPCDDGNACTARCPTCSQDACFGGVCGCPAGSCDLTPSRATTTVHSDDVPQEIPDFNVSYFDSSMVVSIPGNPIIDDVNVQTFLRHSYSSDISMTIHSPAGTFVTLTSHNGADLDDVFNGTVWDDDANPGGQVPYSFNHGLATDDDYVNGVVATPLAPEEPLGAFVGEHVNGVWTLSVDDDQISDGGSLDDWSLTLTTIGVTPTVLSRVIPSTQVPRTIPTTVGTTSSSIAFSTPGTSIYRVIVYTNITHTSNGDLDITLQSPAGTVVTLTSDNGGAFDNVFQGTTWADAANPGGALPYFTNSGLATDHPYANNVVAGSLAPEEGLAAFRGENPNGTWTLTISDDTAGNGGTLNNFSLQIDTATCTASCVVNCSDLDVCTTDSCSPAMGCQHQCAQGMPECIPGYVGNLSILRDGPTLTWDPATVGTTAVHDVARGLIDQLPEGTGAAEVCLASGIAGTDLTDGTQPPAGRAFWYDVRARHACGLGPWGAPGNGPPPSITVCP